MEPIRIKRNSQEGFSLAETLIVLLIILLVSSVVAAGMPAAQRAYVNVLESADAQVFLSTTLIELRDELSTARNIQVSDDGKTVSYDNPITGKSQIFLEDGRYQIRSYMDLNDSEENPARSLVPDPDAAKKRSSLKFNPEPVITRTENNGMILITISGFGVESSKTNSKVAELSGEYSIKVLVPKE